MMFKRIIILCLSLIVLVGCGVNRSEYNRVVEENTQLKNEIDEIKNGADRLIVKMKNAYAAQNFDEVKSTYEIFKTKHMDSSLFADATKIYNDTVKSEKVAEEKKQAEEKRQKQEKLASLHKLKKELDDVSGTTWYKQTYFVHYNNTNLMSLYIGQKDDSVWLRMLMSYEGEDWIFFDKAYLSYEGNTIEIKFDEYKDKKTENDGGRVWEWIDVTVDQDTLNFLREFSRSKDAKMRLSGKYTKTRTLSSNERQGIIDIINGYDSLTQK